MDFQLKDSGARQEFGTGARRDTSKGKGRFDLISPYMLQRLAVVMEKGALKYGSHNWEQGMPIDRFIDSALRHVNQYQIGARDEDHITHAIFNLMAVIHFEELNTRDGLSERQKKEIFSLDETGSKFDNGMKLATQNR